MNTTVLNGATARDTRQTGLLAKLRRSVRRWHEVGRQRRQLANLDARTLSDLGISHIEARQEARRWFWDDPLA